MYVFVEGDELVLDKRRDFSSGRHPFKMRVPLSVIDSVTSGRPLVGIGGTSIRVEFNDGGAVVVDLVGRVLIVSGSRVSLACSMTT